jgi:hypothetical protein
MNRKKCGCGNFDHRYVYSVHLYTILGVGNFTEVVGALVDVL